MKNNKNKMIIVSIALLIGLVGIYLIINNKKNNKEVLVSDKPIVENINVDSSNEITVVSSRIEKMGKAFSIYVKIKNNTNEVMEKGKVKLSIYDKDGQELLVTDVDIVKRLEVGDEVEFQVSSKKDISDASRYVIEKTE